MNMNVLYYVVYYSPMTNRSPYIDLQASVGGKYSLGGIIFIC